MFSRIGAVIVIFICWCALMLGACGSDKSYPDDSADTWPTVSVPAPESSQLEPEAETQYITKCDGYGHRVYILIPDHKEVARSLFVIDDELCRKE